MIHIRKTTGTLEWEIRQGFFTRHWRLYWTGERGHRGKWRVWMATFRELSHLDTYISQFEKPQSELDRLQSSVIARFKSGEITEEEFVSEAMVYSLTQMQCDAIIEDHREETGNHG